jgi:hypothetical protein
VTGYVFSILILIHDQGWIGHAPHHDLEGLRRRRKKRGSVFRKTRPQCNFKSPSHREKRKIKRRDVFSLEGAEKNSLRKAPCGEANDVTMHE